MTEPAELKQGWYFARQMTSEGRGPWCIVWVRGRPPFLTVHLTVWNIMSMDWRREDARWFEERDAGKEWEFGPRIEVPQEVTA